jgi:transposase
MPLFIGIDWASEAHAVCVIDETARVRWEGSVTHSAAGLADLVRQLRRLEPAASLPVALERPSGLLVDTLVDAGFQVVPVHPNVLKASRPRYSAAGGKSDPGDAFILADLLRTDGHRLRPLRPLSDDTRALRTLVRGRDDLVAQRVALANQLRALLEHVWPGAAAIFYEIDSPIALAFLARYPTPQSATRLGEKRLANFLSQHAYSGRRSAPELLARLHAAPASRVGDSEAEATGDLVRSLVAILTPPRFSSSVLPSPRPSGTTQMARSCRRSPAVAPSMPRRSWPSSAMIARASRPPTTSPRRPVSRPSPASRANTAPSSSAGPATNGCGPR